MLALTASADTAGRERGLEWLRRKQRVDGGWAPHPSVDASTWVTALAVCALGSDQRGSDWLLRTTGEESTAKNRWRRWLSGQHSEVGEATSGWPFSAGTAGMVM